jgi:hypothetical protein
MGSRTRRPLFATEATTVRAVRAVAKRVAEAAFPRRPTGRIVASWDVNDRDPVKAEFRTERGKLALFEVLRGVAKVHPGKALLFAVAEPGSVAFECRTLRADKLGRLRVTLGWRYPNGNMLFSASSVMGVWRQRNRATRRRAAAADRAFAAVVAGRGGVR